MTSATAPSMRRLKAQFGEAFHFVMIYIAEVHPMHGVQPYNGDAIDTENDPFAVEKQAETFASRMSAAEGFSSAFDGIYEGLFDYILVDDLVDASGLLYNPTWATYGPCPNGGWLIGQDGIVSFDQFFICQGSPPDLEITSGEAALAAGMKATLGHTSGSGGVAAPLLQELLSKIDALAAEVAELKGALHGSGRTTRPAAASKASIHMPPTVMPSHSFNPYELFEATEEHVHGCVRCTSGGDFSLTSSCVYDGVQITKRAVLSGAFGLPGGEDSSPQLSWRGFPAGTKSFVITCFDPDALSIVATSFAHWCVYDLPASCTSLACGAGDAQGSGLPGCAKQLTNDGGFVGFMGPAPPRHRVHRYIFCVHALNVPPGWLDEEPPPNPIILQFKMLMGQHVLARAFLTPVYVGDADNPF